MPVSTNHKIAAAINLLLSVGGIAFGIMLFYTDVDIPDLVAILTILFGALGVMGSYGIWTGQRWGAVVTIAVRAIERVVRVAWSPVRAQHRP